ncbi:MAG: hypothetical protein HN368_24260 [Spirochaetales bacterium]|nr:hypothetical protein [Spirochaetales bacterium]
MADDYRFGIISDLHLGHSGTGRWHNSLLFDRAEDIVRNAVAVLNGQSLDLVIILGDVSNDGGEDQLKSAAGIFSNLNTSWRVLPGNHDRDGVRSGAFHELFSGHVPDLLGAVAGIPSLFLPEFLPEIEYPRTELGMRMIKKVLDLVSRTAPDDLFIFSHFPLISQNAYALQFKGEYAKHFLDGEEFLDQLGQIVTGKILCFAGHQHWHRIINEKKFVHCMTASMIEYPMEARVIRIADDRIDISTLECGVPDLAAVSLDSAPWVAGSKDDRFLESVQIES